MDPLSVAASCIALISAVTKTSTVVTGFVREVRDARRDLDALSRELSSLTTILELLADDASEENTDFIPSALQVQVLGILTNCTNVVTEIQDGLTKHETSRLGKAGYWTVGGGKSDMAKLRSTLEAHKSALEIALEMLAITITREIKKDTTHLLENTAAIKDDTAQILEEIARLQSRLPIDAAEGHSNEMLQRYLDSLTSYAGTVYDSTENDPEIRLSIESTSRLQVYEDATSVFPTLPSRDAHIPTSTAPHFYSDAAQGYLESLTFPIDNIIDTTREQEFSSGELRTRMISHDSEPLPLGSYSLPSTASRDGESRYNLESRQEHAPPGYYAIERPVNHHTQELTRDGGYNSRFYRYTAFTQFPCHPANSAYMLRSPQADIVIHIDSSEEIMGWTGLVATLNSIIHHMRSLAQGSWEHFAICITKPFRDNHINEPLLHNLMRVAHAPRKPGFRTKFGVGSIRKSDRFGYIDGSGTPRIRVPVPDRGNDGEGHVDIKAIATLYEYTVTYLSKIDPDVSPGTSGFGLLEGMRLLFLEHAPSQIRERLLADIGHLLKVRNCMHIKSGQTFKEGELEQYYNQAAGEEEATVRARSRLSSTFGSRAVKHYYFYDGKGDRVDPL